MECKELGHTRRTCPKVRCRVYRQLGHMSYNCDQREEQEGGAPDEQSKTNKEEHEVSGGQPPATGADNIGDENRHTIIDSSVTKVPHPDSNKEDMDYDDHAKKLKRQHAIDSDSNKTASARCQRLKPVFYNIEWILSYFKKLTGLLTWKCKSN